jgi:hypothetical protein
MRAAASVVIVIAACLGLSGCESTAIIPVPTKQELVGSWRHSAGSAVLDLRKDGSFSLTKVPEGVLEQKEVAPGDSITGPDLTVSGTWKRGSGGNDAGGAPGVLLHYRTPPQVGPNDGVTLVVAGEGSSLQLYIELGFPDEHDDYMFTKH